MLSHDDGPAELADDDALPLGVETAVDAIHELRGLASRVEETLPRQDNPVMLEVFPRLVEELRQLEAELLNEAEKAYPDFDWRDTEEESTA